MRRLILIALLVGSLIYFFSTKYEVTSGRSKDGQYHVILIHKTSGKLTQLMGGK